MNIFAYIIDIVKKKFGRVVIITSLAPILS